MYTHTQIKSVTKCLIQQVCNMTTSAEIFWSTCFCCRQMRVKTELLQVCCCSATPPASEPHSQGLGAEISEVLSSSVTIKHHSNLTASLCHLPKKSQANTQPCSGHTQTQ